MNLYEILEVSPNASQEVLKAAYKSLMQRYHPDKNPDDEEAAARSARIVQAYEVLSDSGKRAAYDIELEHQRKLQSSIQDRPRTTYQPVSAPARKRMPGSFIWLLAVAVVWLVWYVGTSSRVQQPADPAVGDANSRIETLPSDTRQTKVNEPVPGLEARTIQGFVQDIKVNLKAASKPADDATGEVTHVLNIPELGVVVGTFDSSQFLSFIHENRKTITQQLTERLADANYDRLTGPGGEQYLKRIILDAIGDITATNRYQDYPSNDTGAAAHYGIVDVLLPGAFSINTLQSATP